MGGAENASYLSRDFAFFRDVEVGTSSSRYLVDIPSRRCEGRYF